MLITYEPGVVTLAEAKMKAEVENPSHAQRIRAVATEEQLYALLQELGIVLYIQYDQSEAFARLLDEERALQQQIDAPSCDVQLPLTPISRQDLRLCDHNTLDPSSVVQSVDTQSLVDELSSVVPDQEAQLSQLRECLDEMESIAADIRQLTDTESRLSDTYESLDRLFMHYMLLRPYHGVAKELRNGPLPARPAPMPDLSAFSNKIMLDDQLTATVLLDLPVMLDPTVAPTAGPVRVSPDDGSAGTGLLYTLLYDRWGDPDKFFTPEERGLSREKTKSDPEFPDRVGDYYVSDRALYESFYSDFIGNHRRLVSLVKAELAVTISELADQLADHVRGLYATRILSLGLDAVALDAENAAAQFEAAYTACSDALSRVGAELEQVRSQVQERKQAYGSVKCASGSVPDAPVAEVAEPGSDPLGLKMGSEDPSNPNFTKFCYWKKFAQLATAVGLMPLPGPNGLRYWPIGLVLPSPAGPVKVPLPIIWAPLAVISLPVGTLVVFIGQCGICPSPFVLYVGTQGEKKFIVSLRPTKQFGTDQSGGAFKISLKVPKMTLLNDVKDKLGQPVPGFVESDDRTLVLGGVRKLVLDAAARLPDPDISALRTAGTDVDRRRQALLDCAKDMIDRLELDDIRVPADFEKLNPKPAPVQDMLSGLRGLSRLPDFSPPVTIDLKDRMLEKAADINVDVGQITIGRSGLDEQTAQRIRDGLADGARSVSAMLTPSALGLTSVVLQGATVQNPYKCSPTGGATIPPMDPVVGLGISSISAAADLLVKAADTGKLDQLARSVTADGQVTINGHHVKRMLLTLLEDLPPFPVPNPSTAGIRQQVTDGVNVLAGMQLPPLPDPTKPVSPGITIDGGMLKDAVRRSVLQAVAQLPTPALDATTVDVRTQIVGIIEESIGQLEETLSGPLSIISALPKSKELTPGTLFGLPAVSRPEWIEVVPETALSKANAALAALSLVPFPVVLAATSVFSKMHPILPADDLPPWERLTLKNFLFVTFLDQFCREGKAGGGLFENP